MILLTRRKTSGYPLNLSRSHQKCLQEAAPGSRLIVSAKTRKYEHILPDCGLDIFSFFFKKCFVINNNNNSNGHLISPEPVIAISTFKFIKHVCDSHKRFEILLYVHIFKRQRFKYTDTDTSARARARTHTHTHTHTRTHARTHVRTHARKHARSHARTHARTHTPTCAPVSGQWNYSTGLWTNRYFFRRTADWYRTENIIMWHSPSPRLTHYRLLATQSRLTQTDIEQKTCVALPPLPTFHKTVF